MVGKLYKIDKTKTTIKNTVYSIKPMIIPIAKVNFNNSMDNSSNVKNVSFLVSGYYVGNQGVVAIGDRIEINGRTYEISKVTSTQNAMRRTLFNNYFEGI